MDSLDVSIRSSFNAPRMPFFPAYNFPILFLCFLVSRIKELAVAFITAVTPPDCA